MSINRIVPSEYQECVAFWQWSRFKPVLVEYLVHHVNEGKRSLCQGAKLKAIGMRKGLPDYQLTTPNEKYHSLWIEMKTKDKRNHEMPSEQIAWMHRLRKAGNFATFCFGADEAIRTVDLYLNNKL